MLPNEQTSEKKTIDSEMMRDTITQFTHALAHAPPPQCFAVTHQLLIAQHPSELVPGAKPLRPLRGVPEVGHVVAPDRLTLLRGAVQHSFLRCRRTRGKKCKRRRRGDHTKRSERAGGGWVKFQFARGGGMAARNRWRVHCCSAVASFCEQRNLSKCGGSPAASQPQDRHGRT